MVNRRTFLKSILAATAITALPAANGKTVVADKEFPFHDIGARGPITEQEQQAVKRHMKNYLACNDIKDIRWGIPGNKDNCQGVLIMNDQFVVTWKAHPYNRRTVWIEVERA